MTDLPNNSPSSIVSGSFLPTVSGKNKLKMAAIRAQTPNRSGGNGRQ